MRQNEAGYATLTVTALCAGLSVIAIAFMNLTTGRANLGAKQTQILQLDARLEGALNVAISDLIHRQTTFSNLSQGSEVSFGGDAFAVVVQYEGDKLNLNQVDASQIEREIARLELSSQMQSDLTQTLRAKRFQIDSEWLTFGELKDSLDHPAALNCLRDRFTIFQSARVLSSVARTGRDGLDGTFLRFIVIDEAGTRGVDATVLLTGNVHQPVLIFDFARFNPRTQKDCEDVSTA